MKNEIERSIIAAYRRQLLNSQLAALCEAKARTKAAAWVKPETLQRINELEDELEEAVLSRICRWTA